MTYDELLRAVSQALPETEGKLAIERVRYAKGENKVKQEFDYEAETPKGEWV